MEKNISTESLEIIEGIEELEDYIERLAISNEVAYDEKFHNTVIKVYAQVITKVKESHLSEEDKGFMTETILELFKEYQ